MAAKKNKPIVKVRPYSYQPNTKELGEDMRIDATAQQAIDALATAVTVKLEPANRTG